MNCRDVFVNVNFGVLFVYACMFVFFILLSLRLDEVFVISYAIICIPIWIWNVVATAGFLIGMILWCRKCTEYREDDSDKVHCGTLVYTFVFLSLLFLGEVMMVVSADNPALPWRAAFTPLYLLAIISGSMVWWLIVKCRGCELELLVLMTCIQVVLLGVRLDSLSDWTVAVTLVPTWLALITSTAILLLYSILVPILSKDKWMLPENKTNKIKFPFFVLTSLLIIVLLAVFLILLVVRLDRAVPIPFGAIFIPLHLAVLALMANEFTREWSGNTWWFGIRLKYGEFLLQKSALVQEFVNVSYIKDDLLPPSQTSEEHYMKASGKENLHPQGAVESIDSPD